VAPSGFFPMLGPRMTTTPREIELFFDIGSPYSYLAASQADAIERRTGAKVRFRPILLGAIFKATGNPPPVGVANKAKWMLADLKGWADTYGIGFRFPSRFPLNTLTAERALTAAERVDGEHIARRFALALFDAYWANDRDVSDRAVLADIASTVGLDAPAVMAATDAQETKDLLRARTDEAVARGAFGAPTFFVGEEMFFGNDRIVLLERLFAARAV
jgi:2-hydroxychromene-2-carboxylate isomerase